MHTLAAAFLVTFAALFPIVNPLEGAPLFYVLTRELPQERQHVLARQVAFNGLALLLGSMVLGPWLLVFFGIELPVVRIAGGLVVTSLGWKLLSQEQWSDHPSHQVPQDAMARAGAFYPLTMPLTVATYADTRSALALLRQLVTRNAVRHTGSPELAGQIEDVRVAEGPAGLRVISSAPWDLVRVAAWAAAAADRQQHGVPSVY